VRGRLRRKGQEEGVEENGGGEVGGRLVLAQGRGGEVDEVIGGMVAVGSGLRADWGGRNWEGWC